MNKQVLEKKDLRNAAYRWISTCISTYGYELQLAPSVVYALAPSLRKIYSNDEDYKKSLNNHFKYFNCMPWLAKLLLGASLAIEDTQGLEGLDAVQDLKVGLMGPLSGIGDTIGWIMIPTIFGSIAAYMALKGSVAGLAIWLLFSAALWFIRVRLVEVGYFQGVKFITRFGEKINVFTEAASILGLTVVGCLIPSVVKLRCGLNFTSGDVILSVQEQIDSIMPSLLPVAAVGIMYYLMKVKKVKMNYLILGTLIISMIGAALGIFTI
ncbi:PTS fructose transporter subunit IID [Lachnospiraceae bacterium oral taxon 500]|nr:PTS fructose transporter subunit IID [Lachnospiraceae bacterium oral taxon 500]